MIIFGTGDIKGVKMGFCTTATGGVVAQPVQGYIIGLVIDRSWVQILLGTKLRKSLGQVVYTYVHLSPSSITWYRPRGFNAVRLGR